MIGRSLLHHRIESPLGQGGMGVVYRALDTKLHRPVAIMVLPPDADLTPSSLRQVAPEPGVSACFSDAHILAVFDNTHDLDPCAIPLLEG